MCSIRSFIHSSVFRRFFIWSRFLPESLGNFDDPCRTTAGITPPRAPGVDERRDKAKVVP
jgi:hypothetical protein